MIIVPVIHHPRGDVSRSNELQITANRLPIRQAVVVPGTNAVVVVLPRQALQFITAKRQGDP